MARLAAGGLRIRRGPSDVRQVVLVDLSVSGPLDDTSACQVGDSSGPGDLVEPALLPKIFEDPEIGRPGVADPLRRVPNITFSSLSLSPSICSQTRHSWFDATGLHRRQRPGIFPRWWGE